MNQIIHKLSEPFPHLIVENMYNDEELELIWKELKFLTKSNKLLDPKNYGAASNQNGHLTNSKALILDFVYKKRELSNILTVNRKLFGGGYLNIFSQIAPHCINASYTNSDFTKVRYYQNGDEYKSHWDIEFDYIVFNYFHKEPKIFRGGELFFSEYDYEFNCKNNSMILIPAYVWHGVRKIILEEESSFTGNGRYCITQFIKIKPES
jgi:hypothetical protein